MKEFNWVGFKKGEFHVYCETQEDSKDFLQKCEREFLFWSDGQKPTEYNYWENRGIYYSSKNGVLTYSHVDFTPLKCPLIKWSVQPDFNFSWKEVFNLIKEGETYVSGDKHISLKNGHLSIGDSSGCMTLHDELFTKKKEERNLVDFAQALKAMQKGHVVYSDFNGFYYKVEDNKLYCSYDDFNQWFHVDLPYAEINGQWLIVD